MKKILIANRGEIAIRIARSCQDLGIKTVGIFSQDDSKSLHLSKVDEAYEVEGKGASAYLNIKEIISIAKEAKVDAVHPGYGFLSENPKFVSALKRSKIKFIGPNERALKVFGDKTAAKALAAELSVPIILGTSSKTNLKQAETFFKGLKKNSSLLIKAISGGGGRGMRVVFKLADLKEAFERASSEAKASFDSPDLYVEEFLKDYRHIEIQILGDGSGNVIHLHERECSIQRRHQKLIEIAPSPSLNQDLKKRMIDASLALGKKIKYEGLATIEFLVNVEKEDFRFIECNPRLQVEHTVTESITSLDLVKLQIQIASGKSLTQLKLNQDQIKEPRGFAIQSRVNMETIGKDGNANPGGGIFESFDLPSGPNVRADSYGYSGYETNPLFDSLIAKIITYSSEDTYKQACKRNYRSLCEFKIIGVPTNIEILKNLFVNKEFLNNKVHTNFFENNLEDLLSPHNHSDLLDITRSISQKEIQRGKIEDLDPLAVLDHGKSGGVFVDQSENILELKKIKLQEGYESVEAPMQGMIVNFDVNVGDKVWEGKTLGIMEAMKMEHEIVSSVSGTIDAINVSNMDTVFEGHSLMTIKLGEVTKKEVSSEDEVDLDWIRPDLQEALSRKEASHDKNRPEAVKKRYGTGHRTARENIQDLCDEGTFLEYGSVVIAAQRRRRSEEDLIKNTSGDGMVCGLGHVNGHLFPEEHSRVMAMSYDYMVLAGTQGKMNHAKKDRMFEIAEQNKLPTILFAEGGGGRPGDTDTSGVAGLDCLAFTYFAQLSGLVPVIGITTGRCFAGNAVLLGCCDIIIATKDSNIGVGGPAMIEGGGLGVFTPDEVGPMDVQVPNGVVDISVKDEEEAVEVAKKYLSYFQGPIKNWKEPDSRKLRFAVPENRLRYYDMRDIIDGIADIDSVLEIRKDWAPGIITSFIRIEGKPVGVVANNPGHLSGAIDSPGADKGSRFIQLCDAFDIPILSLIDCPGIMVGPESEKTALIRHAARMFVVGANIETPLMSVVIRKAYGLGAQAMAGGSFKIPLFTVTWPTGEFGGMGLEGAVKLGYRKELEAIKDPKERIKVYEKMVADSYHRGRAVNMASHFELDDVIDPAETRTWISGALKSLPPKTRTGKRRPNIDTW
ncbi:MAG: carboxyl transferase domain-containing protein [Pseudomonadota bacterium]|nr:carboxyl transferase domain-containing protein [Pseudomonadota bacterium]